MPTAGRTARCLGGRPDQTFVATFHKGTCGRCEAAPLWIAQLSCLNGSVRIITYRAIWVCTGRPKSRDPPRSHWLLAVSVAAAEAESAAAVQVPLADGLCLRPARGRDGRRSSDGALEHPTTRSVIDHRLKPAAEPCP